MLPCVRDVVVDGRTIVSEGRCVGVDLPAIEQELRGIYRANAGQMTGLQRAWPQPYPPRCRSWFEMQLECRRCRGRSAPVASRTPSMPRPTAIYRGDRAAVPWAGLAIAGAGRWHSCAGRSLRHCARSSSDAEPRRNQNVLPETTDRQPRRDRHPVSPGPPRKVTSRRVAIYPADDAASPAVRIRR